MANHDPEVMRLREEGKTYYEIAQVLGITEKAVNHSVNRYRKQVGHKEGQEERRPTVDKVGEYYIVASGNRQTVVALEKLKQLKDLYCGDNSLTINQICRKLDMPRRDFYLIKTAFNITHDDVPFIDEELQERTLDDLVGETLEKRKENYFIKLQQEEIKQLKKEVEHYRKKDYLVGKVHSLIAEHMEGFINDYKPVLPSSPQTNGAKLMLEVSVFDLHLGKLAWKPETGENYDHKIADKRFMSVIHDITRRVEGRKFETIVFPIGQDFFNFDTLDGTTSVGTRQDNDLRWQKLFSKGVEMLIKATDIFTAYAPVHVVSVPGNHDKMTSFYAMQYLDAWYKDNRNVQINVEPKTRKYFEFGKCLIGFTHGDKEKKRIYGNMQVEAPEAWGRTKYREWHAGHLHSEHVKEEHGVIVRNLSSITGRDSWHCESGYVGAIAKSQSFVWDKEKGLQEILLTNIEGG